MTVKLNTALISQLMNAKGVKPIDIAYHGKLNIATVQGALKTGDFTDRTLGAFAEVLAVPPGSIITNGTTETVNA